MEQHGTNGRQEMSPRSQWTRHRCVHQKMSRNVPCTGPTRHYFSTATSSYHHTRIHSRVKTSPRCRTRISANLTESVTQITCGVQQSADPPTSTPTPTLSKLMRRSTVANTFLPVLQTTQRYAWYALVLYVKQYWCYG